MQLHFRLQFTALHTLLPLIKGVATAGHAVFAPPGDSMPTPALLAPCSQVGVCPPVTPASARLGHTRCCTSCRWAARRSTPRPRASPPLGTRYSHGHQLHPTRHSCDTGRVGWKID
ncbi:hypothetical protein NDU88_007155 [Pleurodeles waltl]|uniref:Secreted protein n=1 Tax=Pleurodeles waltl TaxID=8319 RepID=A0AAV7SRQ1_PLEWA|nr:hypothetical protein NDU88_007155 [Pleurodeles waltl]